MARRFLLEILSLDMEILYYLYIEDFFYEYEFLI